MYFTDSSLLTCIQIHSESDCYPTSTATTLVYQKKTPQIAQIMLQPLLTWHHTSAPTGWGLSDHTSPVCSIEKMTELWGGSCVSSWRTSASKPWCWILCLLFFPDQELFLLLPKLASCPRALGPPLSHPFPLLILTSPLLSLASPVLPSTGSIPNSILTGCYFSHLKNRTKQNDQPIKQKQLSFFSFFLLLLPQLY